MIIVLPEHTGTLAYFLGDIASAPTFSDALKQVALKNPKAVEAYRAKFPAATDAELAWLSGAKAATTLFRKTMSDIAKREKATVIAPIVTPILDDALEPTDARVFDTTFVFSPEGEITAQRRRVFLTDEETQTLGLSSGPIAEVRPFELDSVKVGISEGVDAQMPEIADRLAALGTRLLIAPVDTADRGAWAATQKHGSIRYGLPAMLTGQLFERQLDAETAVVTDTWKQWTFPDREDVITADVDLKAPFDTSALGPAGALGASRAIDEENKGGQREPALASDELGNVFAAWVTDANGLSQVMLSESKDGGVTFSKATPLVKATQDQRTPALAAAGGAVFAAYAEGNIVRVAKRDVGASSFVVTSPLGGTNSPQDTWSPSLSIADGRLYVAYVASTDSGPRIIAGSSDLGADEFDVYPIDPVPVGKPTDARNAQWAPVIAARAGVAWLSWIDHRDNSADVYWAQSSDFGSHFTKPVRVNDGGSMATRLLDEPSIAFVTAGPAVAWSDVGARFVGPSHPASVALGTAKQGDFAFRPRLVSDGQKAIVAAWQDLRNSTSAIYVAVSADGGATFKTDARVDDAGAAQALHPAIALSKKTAIVAWEDTRSGERKVRFTSGPF
jgi:predicted amidohydrolase